MRTHAKTGDAKKPPVRGLRRLAAMREATARLFYRATGIEVLDQAHPGLKALVEECLSKRVPHGEIVRQAKEKFQVELSSAGIRRHWQRRVQPEEIRFLELLGKTNTKAAMVRREAARFPNGDASKIIEALISQQIIEDQLKLGEADIMKLAAEQRLRKRLEFEQERLKLVADRAREEQKLAEARLAEEQSRQASVRGVVENAEAAARDGQPFDPGDVYAKISAVIAGDGAVEERVESSEL